MSVERIEKTFSCPDTAKLYLSNIRGSVRVQPGEDKEITVAADKRLDSGDGENTHDILIVSTNEVGTFKEGQEKEIIQDLPQKRIDVLDQVGLGELSVDQAVQILARDPLA